MMGEGHGLLNLYMQRAAYDRELAAEMLARDLIDNDPTWGNDPVENALILGGHVRTAADWMNADPALVLASIFARSEESLAKMEVA